MPRQLTIPENHPTRRKHGRHRIFFGDAKSVNILTTPDPQEPTEKRGQQEKKTSSRRSRVECERPERRDLIRP